jgi:hypothetical protein
MFPDTCHTYMRGFRRNSEQHLFIYLLTYLFIGGIGVLACLLDRHSTTWATPPAEGLVANGKWDIKETEEFLIIHNLLHSCQN